MAFVQIVLTFPFAAYKINDGLVYRLALLGTVPAKTGVLPSMRPPGSADWLAFFMLAGFPAVTPENRPRLLTGPCPSAPKALWTVTLRKPKS